MVFNVGSAVILPEVFLKALSLARNLGNRVERFTAVNLDFIRHYRPEVNVVERPTRLGGRGISLIGHHEIMVPLLAAGVIEAVEANSREAGQEDRRQERPRARRGPGERADGRSERSEEGGRELMGRPDHVLARRRHHRAAGRRHRERGKQRPGAGQRRGGSHSRARGARRSSSRVRRHHGPIEVGEAPRSPVRETLPARFVIHAAGMSPGGQAERGRACARACGAASSWRARTRLPDARVSGRRRRSRGFSLQRCAEVSIEEARRHLAGETIRSRRSASCSSASPRTGSSRW